MASQWLRVAPRRRRVTRRQSALVTPSPRGGERRPQRLDAVDAAAREPTRLVREPTRLVSRRRPCRAGENTIPYNEEFRLFLTTKMPNPHYSPEVQVKISLVNFTVTQSGLEEQLLGATVCISVRQLIFALMVVEGVPPRYPRFSPREGGRVTRVSLSRHRGPGFGPNSDTIAERYTRPRRASSTSRRPRETPN